MFMHCTIVQVISYYNSIVLLKRNKHNSFIHVNQINKKYAPIQGPK